MKALLLALSVLAVPALADEEPAETSETAEPARPGSSHFYETGDAQSTDNTVEAGAPGAPAAAGTGVAGSADGAPPPNPGPPAQPQGGACEGGGAPMFPPYEGVEPNGWFPKVSPDARYVAFGFGKLTVLDVAARKEKVVDPGSAFSVAWIRPGVITWLREKTNETADRYEASAPDFVPVRASGDPGTVGGGELVAGDGHWASWLAGRAMRVAYDNRVLASGVGGGVDTSRGVVVHAKDGENSAISVWRDGVKLRDLPVKTPMHELTINRGYIVYGGYGPIHGISPTGQDVDLTLAPGRFEGAAKAFFVQDRPWVASAGWSHGQNRGWIMLRPWGARAAVILPGGASGLSAAADGCTIVVARCTDKGALTVFSASANAAMRAPR